MRPLLYKTFGILVVSKSLTIASPFFLKIAVNALATATAVNLGTALLGIGLFGMTRIGSSVLHEIRMVQIQELIQTGIKKISLASFTHLHSLDLTFHKLSSKTTVFAINRAIRSIENGLRFLLGFFMPVVGEFVLLSGMLYFYCGPYYLANMFGTLAIYTVFSKEYSKLRK